MSIMNSPALWFLLFAVPIVLLYMLKMRRKERPISSTLLWSQVLQDIRANTPFQKLRRNLLLILQLLILALLVGALLRILIKAQARKGRSIVLILDCSASMLSEEEEGRRFSRARSEALELVKNMGAKGEDEMMIIQVGSRALQRRAFTSDKNLLASTITALEASAEPTNLSEALVLAQSTIKDKPGGVIHLLSDGAIEDLVLKTELKGRVEFTSLGKTADNVAIVALDVRRIPALAGAYQVFTTVKNFSLEAKSFILSLSLEKPGKVIDAREINLAPGEAQSVIFSLELEKTISERIILAVEDVDALDVDNEAYAILSPPKELAVLLVTEGNPFLQKVLTLDPLVKLTQITPSEYRPAGRYDLIVFDSWTPEEMPPERSVFIAPRRNVGPIQTIGTIQDPTIASWRREERILRFVSFADVHIARAGRLELPPQVKVLVESAAGEPLMALVPYGEAEHLVIAFNILESDWPLRSSFIVFFANLKEEARAAFVDFPAKVKAGQAIPIRSTGRSKFITITSPSRTEYQFPDDGSTIFFNQTGEVGFYRVESGGGVREFAVSLLEQAESDIRPRGNIYLGGEVVEAGTTVTRVNREIWPWFALLALLVVMLEWYAYHRRMG